LRLPINLPNSFNVNIENESYSINYKLTIYFESDEPVLKYSVPIIINNGVRKFSQV